LAQLLQYKLRGKFIYDSAAETPCYAINITFYCHPERSEGS